MNKKLQLCTLAFLAVYLAPMSSAHAQPTNNYCGQYQYLSGKLVNICSFGAFFLWCGTGPTGNSNSALCENQHSAIEYLDPGKGTTVTDQYGGYANVYSANCDDGSLPVFKSFDGVRIIGQCK